jgi:hypothetical protein
MSGGGGGGGYDRPHDDSPCESFNMKTPLNSVDQAAAQGIKAGDLLGVATQGPKGPVVALNKKQGPVGAITGGSLGRLLECIEAGFEFVAEVESVNGGNIVVRVRPK